MKKSWSIVALLVAAAFCITTFDNDLFNVPSTSLIPVTDQNSVQFSPELQSTIYSSCVKEFEQKLKACNSILIAEERCQCSISAIENFQDCTPDNYTPEKNFFEQDSSILSEISKIATC